jgi:cytochrome c55X
MRKPLFVLLLAPLALSAAAGEIPSAERQKALVHMVREDCGSCHGLTLKGGLGPALLPEALAGKDAASLASTILNGRPGTPMPPWKAFLTADEAQWIVQQLQKGFPNDAR